MNRQSQRTFSMMLLLALCFVASPCVATTLGWQQPGNANTQGVTDQKIVIGTALPASGPLAEMGEAAKAVIDAVVKETNLKGGIHGRQLEIKFTETADTALATRTNIDRLIKEEKVFVLAGVFLAGAEREVLPLLAEQQVPLVGPITLNPQPGVPLNRQVFYLFSGNHEHAQALVHFVATNQDAKNLRIAVVYSPSALSATVLSGVKEQLQIEGVNPPMVYEYAPGSFDAAQTIGQLKSTNPTAVFFLGNSKDLPSFMTEADRIGWFPQTLLSTGPVSSDLLNAPVGFDRKLLFTVPTVPSDISNDALQEFRALGAKYKLPQKHTAAQLSVYAATQLLIDALRRAGKDLTRERLLQVLEGLSGYRNGLTPELTFGPTRRIGAMGAYVVTVDLKQKKFVEASGWVPVK